MDPSQASTLSLAEMRERLATPGVGDPNALAYMQLCGLSYHTPRQEIARLVADPNRVAPWGRGAWSCIWGPAWDDEDANLAYVAAFRDANGVPVAAVLVVRGTDITDNVWGDLYEAFEDLQVQFQYPLPWLPSGSQPLVAGGTLDALTTIQSLLSGGATLRQFLTAFLSNPAHRRPVLVVTGHSLGGCLATVVAPWLRLALAGNGVSVPIVPATFAAPTAGNAAFAQYLGTTFPYAPRYYNTLDMVPHGWGDLDGVKRLYDGFGLATPLWVDGAIDVYKDAIWAFGATYAQPADPVPLTGRFCPGFDWLQEISTQHDHRTYIALMKGERPPCFKPLRPRNRHYDPEVRESALGEVQEPPQAEPAPPAS